MISSLSGVLPLFKPRAMTSHQTVAFARKKLAIRRIGHCGTLDPWADGLLILLIGPATRLQRFFLFSDKTYLATVTFGKETDTGDVTGKILKTSPGQIYLKKESIEEVMRDFFWGEIEQTPPVYSAIHIDGRRAYNYARKNLPVKMPRRRVRIEQIDILNVVASSIELQITCSAGTYIRSLATDLGRKMGIYAHLSALRRIRSGSFELNEAIRLENIDRKSIKHLHSYLPLQNRLALQEERDWMRLKKGDHHFIKNKLRDGLTGLFDGHRLKAAAERKEGKIKIFYFAAN